MSASVLDRPAAPPPPPVPPRRELPAAVVAVAAGIAVLLAGAPVAAVVDGAGWPAYAVGAVAVVVATGLAAQRLGPALVAALQIVVGLEYVVAVCTGAWWPGPAAFEELTALVRGAGEQIGTGAPPIAATPEILLLVTTAFTTMTVAVYAVAVSARSPAAAAVPLLAIFAVPTALTSALLPWWAIAAPAAGLGLLLLTRRPMHRLLPAGMVLTAVAVVIALAVGSLAGFVGTSGRFGNGGAPAGGTIGLNAFTALRGHLTRGGDTPLFDVEGLPAPQYLRALTLRDFVADSGFRTTAPAPGVPVTGPLPTDVPSGTNPVTIDVHNVGFEDYWLPLYGAALSVQGLPDAWAYDPNTGIAYSTRQRDDDEWTQQMLPFTPTADQLRTAPASGYRIDAGYLGTNGVDPRVGQLATRITAGRATPFDKAMALLDHFTGPASQFHYSLATAPGAGDDALVEFLTVGRTGYCEQFATAMAVMLRTVGVPARVAVGFTGGREGEDGSREIGSGDAHAWVEAYFAGYGWTTFDPTPLTDGRTIVPAYVAQAREQAGGQAPEQGGEDRETPQSGADPADQPPPETTEQQSPSDDGAGGGVLVAVLVGLGVLVLVGALAAPALLRASRRRRRLAAVAAGGPDAAAQGWAELLAESADRGIVVPASDTVRAAARRLVREHRLDEAAQAGLREIVRRLEASWYGVPGGSEADDPATLTAAVATVRQAIADGSPLSLRDRALPRSLRRGRAADTPAPAADPVRP